MAYINNLKSKFKDSKSDMQCAKICTNKYFRRNILPKNIFDKKLVWKKVQNKFVNIWTSILLYFKCI